MKKSFRSEPRGARKICRRLLKGKFSWALEYWPYGVNVRPLDAKGNRTQTSARKTIEWQSQQATQRANKKLSADFAEQIQYALKHGQAAYEKKYGKP